ncbi:hypothetical protein JTB14_037960 [Gonioctena quinquepunctata]|nr:hypothetical protein JTB14_037960 [Gonioctena quinquepunctata]
MCWTDPVEVPNIKYFSACTDFEGTGSWIFEDETEGGNLAFVGKRQKWQIPPGALVGGEENGEPAFIIRAKFGDGLIPEYEVLCNVPGQWIPSFGGNIPPNALTAGYSKDGEPLYIGRIFNNNAVIIGRVQATHGLCFIPYKDKELSSSLYEIMVYFERAN